MFNRFRMERHDMASDCTIETERFLRAPQVIQIRGDSRTTLYRDIAAGLFPRPVRLGARNSGWPASEVNAVTRARIAGKSPHEIRELVQGLEAQRVRAADGVST